MDQIINSSTWQTHTSAISFMQSKRLLRLRPYFMKAQAIGQHQLYYECEFMMQAKSYCRRGKYQLMNPCFADSCESRLETASQEASEGKLGPRKWSEISQDGCHSQTKSSTLTNYACNDDSRSQEGLKRNHGRVIGINLPKIAALIFHLVVGSQALIQLTQKPKPQILKILMAVIFNRISESVPDEIFNSAFKEPEQVLVSYISTIQIFSKRRNINNLISSFEIESNLSPGMLSKIADELKRCPPSWLRTLLQESMIKGPGQTERSDKATTNSDAQDEVSDILKNKPKQITRIASVRNQNKEGSLIQQLYCEGAFLHPDFKAQALQDGKDSKFLQTASDILFKLPYVSADRQSNLVLFFHQDGKRCLNNEDLKQTYLKLVLQRGPPYMEKRGIEMPMSRVYQLVERGIKARISSGRPVQNLLLDKIAMSSINTMIQKGLLPHFDFLIAKQIAAFLDGQNESTRSQGWKRKFNARYKRYQSSNNLEYFAYPIPEAQQLEFLELFKVELRSKARYLSYKKKSLYAWLNQ